MSCLQTGRKTIRTITKVSTAKCNLDTYTLFLLADPKYAGCNRLSEILGDVSHDSVNRFLLREGYEPKDLFNEVKPHIQLVGGTLSGDDAVIDKPYSNPNLTELIEYFWSGKQHRIVKGINLITLYYTDRYCQLNRASSKLSTIIPQSLGSLNLMQQVSDKRCLANLQSVGAVVLGIVERSVDVVLGGSARELVQKRKEIIGLDWAI